MKKKCLIMMASYNGEKYISQQIESIIDQDYENWVLIIQDDESTDNTVKIINEYVKKDNRIRLWKNKGKHGPYYNFHSLINKCKDLDNYDYYMFSDHDDIWLPCKISKLIAFCENNNKCDMPTLAYADMKIIDGTGRITSESVNALMGMKYSNSVSTFFTHNVFGCNALLNSSLFKVVPKVDVESDICKIISHDNYYTKFAAIMGKVMFLDNQLMLYRRYGGNVTAKHFYSYGIIKIINRIKDVDDLAKDHALTYKQSIYTLNQLESLNLQPHEQCVVNNIKMVLSKGGVSALLFMIRNQVYCGKILKTISRSMILLSGLYKKYL
ncbi:glycosyltransferase [Clostridium beijerinckii]|uniref:glycosyltransferase n=1 Tax=Clostridium beijerinckii TaxID=1520 RepID=UPI0002F4E5F4|nr:glycosyltransferase [Clostridium beijerinckii]